MAFQMHVWRTLVKMEGLVQTMEKVVGVFVYPPMEETSARQVSYLHACIYIYYLHIYIYICLHIYIINQLPQIRPLNVLNVVLSLPKQIQSTVNQAGKSSKGSVTSISPNGRNGRWQSSTVAYAEVTWSLLCHLRNKGLSMVRLNSCLQRWPLPVDRISLTSYDVKNLNLMEHDQYPMECV